MRIAVSILWGWHVLGLILLTGMYLSFSTGFFQLKHIFRWIKYSLFPGKRSGGGISPFAALSAALAGSIGTGNIVGVGAAIAVGGAGAIFWMWIAALFGMMTVFAEVLLSSLCSTDKLKGAIAYISKLGKGKILPPVYAAGCLLSSLSMGNMAQSNAVSVGLSGFGMPMFLTGIFLAFFMFFLAQKGIKGVTRLTEKLVPLMTLVFFVFSVCCLVKFRARIPGAFREIFSSAFSIKAGLGGGMFLAVKTGVSRGVFTNEAGLGSSSMAFCEAKEDPVKLGYLGIFQVFADTIVMCLITALCILVSTKSRSGEYLALEAFEEGLGVSGKNTVNVCMILFAFAAMASSCYYGKIGFSYLFRDKLREVYPFLAAVCAFLGATIPMAEIFRLCDAFNGLMAIPNILALLYLSPLFVRFVNNGCKDQKCVAFLQNK